MSVGYTYTVDKECPVCGAKIQVTKTRSRLIKVSRDMDFCVHYKDFNPYYYSVWVCCHCGYAAEEAFFEKLVEADKKKIADFLAGRVVKIEQRETRTWAEAVASYKLAIFFGKMIDIKASRLAGLCMKLAWLYREDGNAEKERLLMRRAQEFYERSLAAERYPIGSLTDTAVVYLIGVLSYKLGDFDKATQFLSQVIGDRRARMEPLIYNMARDLWQEIRQEKEAEEAEQS